MNADGIMHLCDFIASREDPRILVLDVRRPAERQAFSLSNRFFSVVYAPHEDLCTTIVPIATLVGQRHVIVVDTREEQALTASRLLQSIEVESAVLEGGLDGWRIALVEESAEAHGDVRIVALSRVACDLRSYIALASGEAIVVNPSGCVEAFLAEFKRQRCRPIAVVDTAFHRDRRSCGPEISALTGAAYYVPSTGPRAHVGFAALTVEPNGSLAVNFGDVCIADRDDATFRVQLVGEPGRGSE
jgi:rhodanese-related sulfurtransferase